MAELRGSVVGDHGDGEQRFCKRFLAAGLVQAVKDALRGDAEAAAWLAGTGAVLADDVLGIPPEVLATWPRRARDLRTVGRKAAMSKAERSRLDWTEWSGQDGRETIDGGIDG